MENFTTLSKQFNKKQIENELLLYEQYQKKNICRRDFKILNKYDSNQNERCNCRNRNRCPLKSYCLIDNVIYKADVKKEEAGSPCSIIGRC